MTARRKIIGGRARGVYKRSLTEKQLDVVCRMRAAGAKLSTIRDAIGCTIGAVCNVLHSPLYASQREAAKSDEFRDDALMIAERPIVPRKVERERERRLRGYLLRSITGWLMGDPPVGFSAWDAKLAAMPRHQRRRALAS